MRRTHDSLLSMPNTGYGKYFERASGHLSSYKSKHYNNLQRKTSSRNTRWVRSLVSHPTIKVLLPNWSTSTYQSSVRDRPIN